MDDAKTRLLETALQLFSKRGYANVGIQEIVDTVGVGKPTLYYHFKSKEGLLDAIFAQRFDQDLPRLRTVCRPKGDIPRILPALAWELGKLATAHPDFSRLLITLSYSGRQDPAYLVCHPYLDRLQDLLHSVFVDAREQMGNMHGREKQFSESFRALLFDYLFQCLDTNTPIDRKRMLGIVNQFQYGINS